MEKKHIVSDRGIFIVKIDYDLWQRIAEHLQANYDKYTVEIALEDSAETFRNMNDAYEHICVYTDEIIRIKVVAKAKEDLLNITIKNFTDFSNIHNVEIYAECSSFEMENAVRMDIMEMIGTHRVHCCGIRVVSALFVILIMNHMSELFIQNQRVAYPVITSLLITLVGAAVLFFGAVPLAQRLIYGKSKIAFMTNFKNIEKYRKMRRADIIVSCILAVAAIVLTILSFAF